MVHVVRCFEDENVIHVDGSVDPVRDAELINLELALADLAQVEKRMERVKKDRKADPVEKSALEKLTSVLYNDEPARNAVLTDEEELAIKSLGLLTRKKMIYAANVADEDLATGNEMVDKLREVADREGAKLVVVSAQVESELIELSEAERVDFLASLGLTLDDTGLRKLVREAYDILGLQTYYTSGPKGAFQWLYYGQLFGKKAKHSEFMPLSFRHQKHGHGPSARDGRLPRQPESFTTTSSVVSFEPKPSHSTT